MEKEMEYLSPAAEEETIRSAQALLEKYRAGKTSLDQRIVENEQWYRQRHWDVTGHSRNENDPHPASGWLFNALAGKHADAMDHFPSLTVLPRARDDMREAESLSRILPVVLEMNDYEQVYSDMWWYKLRSGTGVTGVFWDPAKNGGAGDIAIRSLDLLNLFWEPGVNDIQDSPSLFYISMEDRDRLRDRWAALQGEDAFRGEETSPVMRYVSGDRNTGEGRVPVIDWYVKKRRNGKDVLHLVKICAGHVLFDSRMEPGYEEGYYHHGKYPFVLDALFPIPNSPAGFGYLDTCKSAQMYIDRLDQALLKNTLMGARPRHWVRGDGAVNEAEYADLSRDFVHFTGSGNPQDSIFPMKVPELNPYAITMRQSKIDELKEVSGNRDFSQGGTSGGVTAFSAIQALKETGSKLSRDMISAAYRAFAKVGSLCIELMRQFYREERTFRILGAAGESGFESFSGQLIGLQQAGDDYLSFSRTPVFDIRVIPRKGDPYDAAVQNERAQALYQLGFFEPQRARQALIALEMMDFDGVERVKKMVREG